MKLRFTVEVDKIDYDILDDFLKKHGTICDCELKTRDSYYKFSLTGILESVEQERLKFERIF